MSRSSVTTRQFRWRIAHTVRSLFADPDPKNQLAGFVGVAAAVNSRTAPIYRILVSAAQLGPRRGGAARRADPPAAARPRTDRAFVGSRRRVAARTATSAMPPTSSTRSCPPRSTGCSSSTEAGHPSGMNGGSPKPSSINCSPTISAPPTRGSRHEFDFDRDIRRSSSVSSCASSSSNSVPTRRPCSNRGPLETSLPTSCCVSTTTSRHPAWSSPGHGIDSPRLVPRSWPSATSRRSSIKSDRDRRLASSASDGSGDFPTSTSSSCITRTCAGPTAGGRGATRRISMQPCGATSLARPGFLLARLRGVGLELEWAGTNERVRARRGEPTARLVGPPGELLLYLFGR